MKINNSIKKIVINCFAIFGFISLIAIIVLGGYLTYSLTLGNKTEIDKAKISDVRFVLNWCELGDGKIEKVLKSSVSATGFSGDYHDAYLIKIKSLNENELKNIQSNGKWFRGDNLPKILDDAISFATEFNGETPWFTNEKNIKTSDCYIYSNSIDCNGLSPRAVQLIILKQKLVYYIGVSI